MRTSHPFQPYLFAITFAFAVCQFTFPSFAQDNLADVIENSEKSVVRIEVAGAKGNSLGSGFVVDSSGVFVTNVHVLAGASKAIARFPNGEEFEVAGTYYYDESRDICVAQLKDARRLPTLELADDLPRKGEQAIALGSPHGLSFSASRGIVSAIREQEEFRSQTGRTTMQGTWIQTDAAISGGNSGGPMINSNGEVIGMSTLGSAAAEAQNLNFGISVDDIRNAITKARGSSGKLTSLKKGIGKVDMEEVQPESSGIARSAIPEAAVEAYIERGSKNYSELASRLKKSASEAKSKLRAMKKGETFIPGRAGDADYVVQARRGTDMYYFRNENVKDRVISRQQSRSNRLQEIRQNLSAKADRQSLFTLLMNGGPRLDPRQANEIGFMDTGIVLHAINDHDIVVVYDDAPYLMWVKSTAGLSIGQEVTPGPVYVAGTETVTIPGQGSMSLTILNSVMESEVKKVVLGDAEESLASKNGMRTWKDKTGKHTIEAKLVAFDGSKVILEKENGELITVPVEKLSTADLKFLKN